MSGGLTEGTSQALALISSLTQPVGIVLGACVLLGIALAAVRYFTSTEEKPAALARAKGDAGKVVAVGLVSALLLAKDGVKGVYEKLTSGALTSVTNGTSPSTSGQSPLVPDSFSKYHATATDKPYDRQTTEEKNATDAEGAVAGGSTLNGSGWNSPLNMSDSEQMGRFYLLCRNYSATTWDEYLRQVTGEGRLGGRNEEFRNELRKLGISYPEDESIKEAFDHNNAMKADKLKQETAGYGYAV